MDGRVPEDLAVVVDAVGTVKVWSAGARQLLGYEAEEVVGRPAAGLLAADLPESARRHVAVGRRWATEVALRHRDGGRVVVRLTGTPLADGDGGQPWLVTPAAPEHVAGPVEPDAEALWDLTLAQLPVPVAVYDREARLVSANEVMTQVMGRSLAEMRGLTLWDIEPNPPFDEYDRLQRQVLRTGEPVFHENFGQAPGEVRGHAWSMFLSPLKDESGVVRGVSAAVFDTTEQYWARRRLAILNDASIRIGSTLDVTRTADELAEVAVTGFADFVTVDLLESVALGEEPEPVPPDRPVTLRRTAQRSVLDGCPESVVPTGATTSYPVDTPPMRALIMRPRHPDVSRGPRDAAVDRVLPGPCRGREQAHDPLGDDGAAARPWGHPGPGALPAAPYGGALQRGRRAARGGDRREGGGERGQRPPLHPRTPHRAHPPAQPPPRAPAGPGGHAGGVPLSPGGLRRGRRRGLVRRHPAVRRPGRPGRG